MKKITDEDRYNYIKNNLTQGYSPHMDGTFSFRFSTPYGRGRSLDEIIDKLIIENSNEKSV